MAWDREKERKAGKNLTIAGCIYGLLFSIVWCILAAAMGAWFMLIFGIPFACLMGYRLVMCLKLAKGEKEHPPADPWDRPSGQQSHPSTQDSGSGYCPYCGSAVQTDFEFCPKCGRRLS